MIFFAIFLVLLFSTNRHYGMEDQELEIISSDNMIFKLPRREFSASKTLNNLFEDTQEPTHVPFDSKTLIPLTSYLKGCAEGINTCESDLLDILQNKTVEDDISILGAANFLDIVKNDDKPLSDSLCVWLVKEKHEKLFNYLKSIDIKKISPIAGLLKNTIREWTIQHFKDIRHNKPIDQNEFKEFLLKQKLPWFIERFTADDHQKSIICSFIIEKAPQTLDKKKLELLCGDDSYYYDEFKVDMWDKKTAPELIRYLEVFSYLGNPQTVGWPKNPNLNAEKPKLMKVNIKTELIKLLVEKLTIAEYELQKNKFHTIRAGEFDKWSLAEELEDILRKQIFEFCNRSEKIKNKIPHFKDFFKQFLYKTPLSFIINLKKKLGLKKIEDINEQFINEIIPHYEKEMFNKEVKNENVDQGKKGFLNTLYYNYYIPYKKRILGVLGIGLGIGGSYFLWKKYRQKNSTNEKD